MGGNAAHTNRANGIGKLRRIETAIANNETQTKNLVDAIARGVPVDTVLARIQELESERKRLAEEKNRIERFEVRSDEIKNLAHAIAAQVGQFERAMESAPIHVQKQWVRRFVMGIVVERDRNRAVCRMMRSSHVQPSHHEHLDFIALYRECARNRNCRR